MVMGELNVSNPIKTEYDLVTSCLGGPFLRRKNRGELTELVVSRCNLGVDVLFLQAMMHNDLKI